MILRKHIPNAITSLNLLCGVIGIIFALNPAGSAFPRVSLCFMLAASCFDFCDGLAARILGVISPVGKELDSLSDVVSFGVLPAVMMYSCIGASPLRYAALLLAVFSALRLARFNLDERQHDSFIGLPTPASALIAASLCCVCRNDWIILAAALVLCWLLVSDLPMFSFKFGSGTGADAVSKMKRTAIVSISVIVVILVVLLALPWPAAILGILTCYVLENVIFSLLAPHPSRK